MLRKWWPNLLASEKLAACCFNIAGSHILKQYHDSKKEFFVNVQMKDEPFYHQCGVNNIGDMLMMDAIQKVISLRPPRGIM